MLAHNAYPGNRATGLTTIIALRAIALAMANVGEPVKLTDHHDSPGARCNLKEQVNKMLSQLDLRHFRIHRDGGHWYLTFGD
ncbi:hypothetical protein [Pseudomonas phage Misse]|nr:hypothetical protein [Pseudomonas phage Misse]